MQKDEVFYLPSNLLSQQFTHSYTGFLDLVKMVPGSIAVNFAEQSHHFTKTRALGQKVTREGNNSINKKQNQETWDLPLLKDLHPVLYLNTEVTE